MIAPSDIGGNADLARRIIATARSIAPCLDKLVDGATDDDPMPRSDAIAILKGVATDGASRGSRLIKSQMIATARVEYNPGTWWSEDDRAALRALCPASATSGLPIGSFPPGGIVKKVWPEFTDS